MRPAVVGVRLEQVQRPDVERLTRTREDDALQKAFAFDGPVPASGISDWFTGVTVIYSAPAGSATSGAPSRRCGARVLSNMVSALAIAMCMSRY